jgi:hypothetical protein
VGVSILAVEQFLAGHRVLYATPTAEQIGRFWTTVTRALAAPIAAGMFRKNETEHIIERVGTEQRIRAKTAYNADSLRGDTADLLILDEFQLMNEDTWGVVGAPMLLDNNGRAIFIYTPPSLRSAGVSKAHDPQHASKLFKRAAADDTGRWATFHFRSTDNPHISQVALSEIASDMTALAYRQEIMAEEVDEAPGALWKRAALDAGRVVKTPQFDRVVVAIDPSATARGDEAGIIVAGRAGQDFYPIADVSLQGSPLEWANAAVTAYHLYQADRIVAEVNNGGEMVETVLRQIDAQIPYKAVHASRGKATRAEPIAALYEQCLAAGTQVQTRRGAVPIEDVTASDYVWTRKGLRPVLWSGQTGVSDTIILSASGYKLTCTPDHPIFTDRGFVHAGQLVPKCDIITVWKTIPVLIAECRYPGEIDAANHVRQGVDGQHEFQCAPMSRSMKHGISSRQMVITDLVGTQEGGSFIGMCGNLPMEKYQPGGTFITVMETRETTTLVTLSLSRRTCTQENKIIAPRGLQKQKSTGARLKKSGGKQENPLCISAMNVSENSIPPRREYGSVLQPATRTITIGSVEKGPKQPVYNLEVSGEPEFFANGILVHNCRGHHVGLFARLEDELCQWVPGDNSPNRLDALVWAGTELMLNQPTMVSLDDVPDALLDFVGMMQ